MNDNNIICSFIIGITQSIIGYPLDTLKTMAQHNTISDTTNIKSTYGVLEKFSTLQRCYRGFSYQLGISTINTATCFLTFDYISYKTNSMILAGICTGIVSGIIITPLEIKKVRHQVERTKNISDTKTSGLGLTTTREIIALTCYFNTYHKLKTIWPDNTLINGGLAGCACWTMSYPFDTLKTHRQTGSRISMLDIIQRGTLFRGYGFCMARAFLVNSVGFYIYETFNAIGSI